MSVGYLMFHELFRVRLPARLAETLDVLLLPAKQERERRQPPHPSLLGEAVFQTREALINRQHGDRKGHPTAHPALPATHVTSALPGRHPPHTAFLEGKIEHPLCVTLGVALTLFVTVIRDRQLRARGGGTQTIRRVLYSSFAADRGPGTAAHHACLPSPCRGDHPFLQLHYRHTACVAK